MGGILLFRRLPSCRYTVLNLANIGLEVRTFSGFSKLISMTERPHKNNFVDNPYFAQILPKSFGRYLQGFTQMHTPYTTRSAQDRRVDPRRCSPLLLFTNRQPVIARVDRPRITVLNERFDQGKFILLKFRCARLWALKIPCCTDRRGASGGGVGGGGRGGWKTPREKKDFRPQ
jgi:hypothetical protein